MLEFLFGITLFVLFLLFWAATGHWLWWMATTAFSSVGTKTPSRACPGCSMPLRDQAVACEKCGWSSRMSNAAFAITTCRKSLKAGFQSRTLSRDEYLQGQKLIEQLAILYHVELKPSAPPGPIQVATDEQKNKQKVAPEPVSLPELEPSTARPLVTDVPPMIAAIPIAPPPILSRELPIAARAGESPLSPPVPPPVHPLEQTYKATPVRKVAPPRKSLGEWLSAFMEEKNIRWGELVGGLLIVSCSIALVISFWEGIAARPWLKFGIFTGVNAATLALGLNTWHRWKLPTTSQGILIIGMLLLPLNFLAFAIFTLGMPWDWLTVFCELVSLVLLGVLVWYAAQVIAPRLAIHATSATVGFALMNLLVRRFVQPESSQTVLVAMALVIAAAYLISTLSAWTTFAKDGLALFDQAIKLLAISSFGCILATGLMVACTQQPWTSLHRVSPLGSLLAIPAMMYAVGMGLHAKKQSQGLLWVVGLIACSGVIGGASLLLSWPTPVLLVATIAGLNLLGAVAFRKFWRPGLAYFWYGSASAIAVFGGLVVAQRVGLWNEDASVLLQAMANPLTGFLLIGMSAVCVSYWVVLLRANRGADALVAIRSAGIAGGIGTLVVSVFGLGRHEYATSIALIYVVYAAGLMIYSTLRERSRSGLDVAASEWKRVAWRYPVLDGIAGLFLVLGVFQGLAVGWLHNESWLVAGFWTSTLAAILLTIASAVKDRVLRRTLIPAHPIQIGILGLWGVGTFLLWLSLFILPTMGAQVRMGTTEFLIWTLLTWSIAFLREEMQLWSVGQIGALATVLITIYHRMQEQTWFIDSSVGELHPYLWHRMITATAVVGAVFALARLGTAKLYVSRPQSTLGITALRFHRLHRQSIADLFLPAVMVFGSLLLVYGALPGAMQELLPRDGLQEVQTAEYEWRGTTISRDIPSIDALSLKNVPREAAGWTPESVAHGLWGLPSSMWMWIWVMIALVVWNATNPTRMRVQCLILWVGLSIYPIATRWEGDISVASTIRWGSAIVFTLGCLCLCSIDRGAGVAQRAIGLRAADNSHRAAFHDLFGILIVSVAAPLLGMGALVIGNALSSHMVGSMDMWIWFVALGIAIVGASSVMASGLRIRSEPAGQSSFSATKIAAMVLSMAPLVAWMALQVVLGLMKHPLTGPNLNSWFVQIGLAASYTIPILAITVSLIGVACVRRSHAIAFSASMLLLLSCICGFMLTLKSKGTEPSAWIALVALMTTVAAVYAIAWQALSGRGAREAQGASNAIRVPVWLQTLQTVAIGFWTMGLVLGSVLLLINGVQARDLLVPAGAMIVAHLGIGGMRWASGLHSDWSKQGLGMGLIVTLAMASFVTTNNASLAIAALGTLGTAIGFSLWSRYTEWKTMPYVWLCIGYCVLVGFRATVESWSPWLAVSILGCCALYLLVLSRRDFWHVPMVLSIVLSSVCGWIYWVGAVPFSMDISHLIVLQVSIASGLCLLGHALNVSARIKPWMLVAILVLALHQAVLFMINLVETVQVRSLRIEVVAVILAWVAAMGYYWRDRQRAPHLLVYTIGLCGVGSFFQALHPSPTNLLWSSALVLAAYMLSTSYLWRYGERMQRMLKRMHLFPADLVHAVDMRLVVANLVLGSVAISLAMAAIFHCESRSLRFASSQGVMAVALGVGLLSRYLLGESGEEQTNLHVRSIRRLRTMALSVGCLAAVAFGWQAMDMTTIHVWDCVAVAALACAMMSLAYGFGLIKWLGLRAAWCEAALGLMPALVVIAGCGVVASLWFEIDCAMQTPPLVISQIMTTATIVTLSFSMIASLAAALLPGKDPLGLSERGRALYVYAAEALLVMLVAHLRVSMPWLFQHWLQSVWPLVVVAIAFVGLGVSEWATRNRVGVLAEPLEKSGSLLSLLPILGHWIVPSSLHYSMSLVTAAAGFAMYGYVKRSWVYWSASLIALNGALLYMLYEADFSFASYPQLWVIPPAMCTLIASQLLRHRLAPAQLTAVRYLATSSIYVASTAEIFIHGTVRAPWLPIVLAGLSVLGILMGIAIRVRSLLWLGSIFLCLAMFTIIWHAAVDLEQTWLWYVCGILMGVAILTMFALFEKRKEDLKRILSTLQTWEE